MDVGLYVSELLNELNEISLPGIGTFYKKSTSAYYDDKQGIFFPPSQEIAFHTGNISASQELIRHICVTRNISEPSARYFTEKYADSIKQSLQIKGFAAIGTIGTLRAGGNEYIFEQVSKGDNSTYGLIPVMEIKKQSSKPAKDTPPDFSAIKIKPQPEPQKPYVETDSRSYKTGIIILLILLLTIGLVVGSYFYYPQFFNLIRRSDTVVTKVEKKEVIPATKPKTLKDSIATADSIMESSFEELKQDGGITIEESRDTINISTTAVPVNKETAKASSTPRYEIICAAFNKQSEAEEYIRTVRKKGIDADIITDDKKPRFKISLGSFSNNEAAQKERRRIQETIAKDAWILTIKNN